ncbi:MAG TPA: hypothetical protein VK572_16145 [Burkholderiales bacterium]|nr:hypothetical protein [Burkholderiales bacterium]
MPLKHGLAVAFLAAASLPAFAKDINNLGNLPQAEFRGLSEDLGAALSYKPLTPTAPLGITGFDMGLAATATKIKNSGAFNDAGAGDQSTVAVPSLRFNKGLPLDLDVGVMWGEVPGTNVRLWGGELRYAIVSGGATMPAIGIRGSYTKLTGVDQLDFNTKGLDLSISKGFLMFTPYAGIGKVWVASTPKDISTGTPPSKETFSLNKVFVGVNLNFGVVNLAFEGDRTGDATSYGAKLGFRF